MLFKLAWRNLWRNKYRTLITVASVFFAVIFSVLMTALQKGAMDNLVKDVVGFYSSYIQIHEKGYFDEQTLEHVLDLNDTLLANIRAEKNVVKASPRIETFVLASTGQSTEGTMMTGIVPSQESELIQLSKKVTGGTYLADTGAGLMIGEGLARKLNVKLNDTLILLGQGYQGATAADRYIIKTILTFGSPQLNDHILFMPLKQAQDFLSAPNKATSIVISINDLQSVDMVKQQMVKDLSNHYEVKTWEEMVPDIVATVKSKQSSELVITLLLYMLVSFGMFATLLMMMAERRFELGMLMAIGMKKAQLAFMVMLESIFVSLVGCVLGIMLSVPMVFFWASHPIKFAGDLKSMYEKMGFEAVIPMATTPSIFYRQAIIIGIVSLLLSAYPMYKIISMNALKAMRK
jgi:ABC-type lipoprotein release transport system permease subunit